MLSNNEDDFMGEREQLSQQQEKLQNDWTEKRLSR